MFNQCFKSLRSGNTDILENYLHTELISVDDIRNDKGDTLLIRFACERDIENCRTLINDFNSSIFSKNNTGRTALIEAVRCRSKAVSAKLIYLLRNSINEIDTNGMTAVMFAASGAGLFGSKKGNVSLTKALVQAEADLTLKDNNGFTALGHATKDGREDINIELVEYLQREYAKQFALNEFKKQYRYGFNDKGCIELSEK